MGFERPWALGLWLIGLVVVYWRGRTRGAIVFSAIALLPQRRTWRLRLAWLPNALLALAMLALCVAMAGPRKGDRNTRIKRQGISIAMVVDTSGSMRALDLSEGTKEQTRLDAVKTAFTNFVIGGGKLPGRPNDAIGLVSFAGHADTRSPLTLDHHNLLAAADALSFPTERGEDGTAIGDGLALAVERLRNAATPSRVAVLLTDGVENAGIIGALDAAKLAQEHRIKVYTIGAGTNGMAPVRVETPFGSELRQVPVEIDEATLRQIAELTGGSYFRANDGASLQNIYKEIDRLERTDIEENQFLEYRQYYPWALLAAMAALAVALLLQATFLRRLP